jgi:thiamine biosynthesis lipoprotein
MLYGESEQRNRRIRQDLLELVQGIEKIASFYDPEAEVNRLPRDAWVPVSGELLEMLALSKRFHRETEGAFDVSMGRLKALWDEARRSHVPPSRAEIDRARESRGMEKLELRPPYLRIRDASLKLDLSGLAKGYAIDKGIGLMRASGVLGGMINIGGDMGVFGVKGEGHSGEWEVGIQDPRPDRRVLGVVSLRDTSIATSGNYERYATVDGDRINHIFDPRADTFPAGDTLRSVTIVSPSCAEADALATAVFAMGPVQGVRFLKKRPSVTGYLIVWGESGTLGYHKEMEIRDFALAE